MERVLGTTQATHAAGTEIGATLKSGDIVTLSGDLGAGKTTMTKGILAYFGIAPELVTSPTFSIMNIYHASEHNTAIQQIVHIDTYRLEHADELLEIGFEEYVRDPQSITIIEWPEKVEPILKSLDNTFHKYNLEHTGDGRTLKSAA